MNERAMKEEMKSPNNRGRAADEAGLITKTFMQEKLFYFYKSVFNFTLKMYRYSQVVFEECATVRSNSKVCKKEQTLCFARQDVCCHSIACIFFANETLSAVETFFYCFMGASNMAQYTLHLSFFMSKIFSWHSVFFPPVVLSFFCVPLQT